MNPRPTLRAYVVEDRQSDTATDDAISFWTRVGSAWPHQDGKGWNVQLVPGVAVSGRLVLREYTPEDESIDGASKGKRGK